MSSGWPRSPTVGPSGPPNQRDALAALGAGGGTRRGEERRWVWRRSTRTSPAGRLPRGTRGGRPVWCRCRWTPPCALGRATQPARSARPGTSSSTCCGRSPSGARSKGQPTPWEVRVGRRARGPGPAAGAGEVDEEVVVAPLRCFMSGAGGGTVDGDVTDEVPGGLAAARASAPRTALAVSPTPRTSSFSRWRRSPRVGPSGPPSQRDALAALGACSGGRRREARRRVGAACNAPMTCGGMLPSGARVHAPVWSMCR